MTHRARAPRSFRPGAGTADTRARAVASFWIRAGWTAGGIRPTFGSRKTKTAIQSTLRFLYVLRPLIHQHSTSGEATPRSAGQWSVGQSVCTMPGFSGCELHIRWALYSGVRVTAWTRCPSGHTERPNGIGVKSHVWSLNGDITPAADDVCKFISPSR
jgi:hypothetical protein